MLYSLYRGFLWRSITTAGLPDDAQTITITHPFSPLKGEKLFFIERIKVAGEDKIVCCDKDRKSRMILTSWTDYPTEGPIDLSLGKSDFRFDDLQTLAKLINDIKNM